MDFDLCVKKCRNLKLDFDCCRKSAGPCVGFLSSAEKVRDLVFWMWTSAEKVQEHFFGCGLVRGKVRDLVLGIDLVLGFGPVREKCGSLF